MDPLSGSMGVGESYGAVDAELPKGKPQVRLEPDDKLHGTPLVSCLAVIVFTVTGGTYYFWSVLPAWEADSHLGWSKTSTLQVNWTTTLAEALGLLLAGPLADYVEPVNLIAVEAMYTFTALFVASHLQSASLLAAILNLLLVHLVKGVLWPSLGSIAFQSIHLERQDEFFFCMALASRLSGAVGDLLLGQLLKWGFTWRSALYLYGGFAGVACLVCLYHMHRLLAGGIHREESPKGTSSMENYGAKWRRLSGDLNGWLALGVLVGSNCIWSLGGYLSVMMAEQFDLSPGAAAQAASSLLGGTFLGLLSAGLVTFFQGRVLGRRLQLLQASIGLGAVLMLVAMPKLSLLPWVLGLLVTGASAGPLLYLPYCVYSASVPRTHRAFSMGILDSMSTATTCGTRILFGRLRIALPSSAGHVMYDVTACGLGLGTLCTALLYARLAGKDDGSTF